MKGKEIHNWWCGFLTISLSIYMATRPQPQAIGLNSHMSNFNYLFPLKMSFLLPFSVLFIIFSSFVMRSSAETSIGSSHYHTVEITSLLPASICTKKGFFYFLLLLLFSHLSRWIFVCFPARRCNSYLDVCSYVKWNQLLVSSTRLVVLNKWSSSSWSTYLLNESARAH